MYEREIARQAMHITALFRRIIHQNAAPPEDSSVTVQGYGRMLKVLSLHGPMKQTELAERLDIRPQSLTVAMTKLETAGLVTRTRDGKDRRQVMVEITEEGRWHSEKIEANRSRAAVELLAGLTEEEKETVFRLLEKVLAYHKET